MTATPNGNGPTPSKPGLGPQATHKGGWERTDGPGHPTGRPRTPDPERPPPTPPAVHAAGGHASAPVVETAEATGARAVGVRQRPGARGRALQGSPTDPLTTDH